MIKTQIGNDAVDPGIERTFETEAAHVPVGFEESLLVNILGLMLRACQPQGQTQDGLVVAAHEVLEGSAVSALSLPHQNGVVNAVQTLSGHFALTGALTSCCPSRRDPRPRELFSIMPR